LCICSYTVGDEARDGAVRAVKESNSVDIHTGHPVTSFFLATIACFAGMISMLEEAEDASLEVVFFSQRIVCVHWVLL
jgi:phosphopantothenate synthetase